MSLGIPFHEVRQWSAAEISLYQCYYRLNPWGVERDDIRTANQTAFIASATGVKKQGGGEFTLADFMPFAERQDGVVDDGRLSMVEAFRMKPT